MPSVSRTCKELMKVRPRKLVRPLSSRILQHTGVASTSRLPLLLVGQGTQTAFCCSMRGCLMSADGGQGPAQDLCTAADMP